MKNKTALALAALLIVISAAWLASKPSAPSARDNDGAISAAATQTTQISAPALSVTESTVPSGSTTASSTPTPAPSATPATQSSAKSNTARSSLASITPDASILRAEVARNPHMPPASLLRFSAQMSQRMKEVLKSETASTAFFGELENCVLGESHRDMPTVQALCLLNARRLSTKYPALKERFGQVSEGATPEANRLANALL